jgi:hypothetical protein
MIAHHFGMLPGFFSRPDLLFTLTRRTIDLERMAFTIGIDYGTNSVPGALAQASKEPGFSAAAVIGIGVMGCAPALQGVPTCVPSLYKMSYTPSKPT